MTDTHACRSKHEVNKSCPVTVHWYVEYQAIYAPNYSERAVKARRLKIAVLLIAHDINIRAVLNKDLKYFAE